MIYLIQILNDFIQENYCGVKDMAIEVEDISQSVYISGCDDSVIKVIGKTSSIVIGQLEI